MGMKERLASDARAFGGLTARCCKIFLRDRAGVFFSLLAPLIVLLLYFLFLGDVQLDAASSALQGLSYDDGALRAFVNGWMIAGVVSVSCVTVSFSAQSVMISDREKGTLSDVLVTPVRRTTVSAAYFAGNCVVTFGITLIVLAVCLVFAAATGWYLTAGDVFAAVGITAMSTLSAAMISTLVCTPLRSSNAHSAFTGIVSAAIGFLMGAYMPVSAFPTAVQYVVLFVPGTYSAGVFRNIFSGGALTELCSGAPPAVESALREAFTLDMDFFGVTVGAAQMTGIFAATLLIVACIAGGIAGVRMIARRKMSVPRAED